MLVRGMVWHIIDDDPDSSAMGFSHQSAKYRQITEKRVHIAIISHVISKVRHWRGVEGADPNCIDAKRVVRAIVQIAQFLDNPIKITHSIACSVFEAAGINLIDHPLLPPESF